MAALAAADPRFEVVATAALADAAIDFTTPEASLRFASACIRAKIPFISGTTGLSDAQRRKLAAAAKKIPVFAAPNFSRGMALMTFLAGEAAKRLPGYDAAIVETHHAGKKDAPSGTGLRLAQAVRAGSGAVEYPPIASLRLGGVIGDHSLIFASPFERLELTHHADSRDVFALGALNAALWIVGKNSGLYDMSDMLGLK